MKEEIYIPKSWVWQIKWPHGTEIEIGYIIKVYAQDCDSDIFLYLDRMPGISLDFQIQIWSYAHGNERLVEPVKPLTSEEIKVLFQKYLVMT